MSAIAVAGYTVSYDVGTGWLNVASQAGNYSVPYLNGYAGADVAGPGSISSSGNVKATIQWNGTIGEQLPIALIIKKQSTVTVIGNVMNCSNGLGHAAVPYQGGLRSTGVTYEVLKNPPLNFSRTIAPEVYAEAWPPYPAIAWAAAAEVDVKVTVHPIYFNLNGITFIEGSEVAALVGQLLDAGFSTDPPYILDIEWIIEHSDLAGSHSWGPFHVIVTRESTYGCYADLIELAPNFNTPTISFFVKSPGLHVIGAYVQVILNGHLVGSFFHDSPIMIYGPERHEPEGPPIPGIAFTVSGPGWLWMWSGNLEGGEFGFSYDARLNIPTWLTEFIADGYGRSCFSQTTDFHVSALSNGFPIGQGVHSDGWDLDNGWPYEPEDADNNVLADGWDAIPNVNTLQMRDAPNARVTPALANQVIVASAFQCHLNFLPPPSMPGRSVYWVSEHLENWFWMVEHVLQNGEWQTIIEDTVIENPIAYPSNLSWDGHFHNTGGG